MFLARLREDADDGQVVPVIQAPPVDPLDDQLAHLLQFDDVALHGPDADAEVLREVFKRGEGVAEVIVGV